MLELVYPLKWTCGRIGCGRSYKYKTNLSRHMRNECGIEPQYKCEICSKAFAHKDKLKSHCILSHKIIWPSKQSS